jgi:DNA (cytosine-5)-methyltransferase 1
MTVKILELFAGYGGASFALKYADIEHEIVAFSEWDKWAAKTFEQNHGGTNLGDVTKIAWHTLKDKGINLITGGTPCQNFSLAGKRAGTHYADGTKTQSGLVYDFMEAIDTIKPEVFIFENVGGALSSKNENGEPIIPMLEKAFQESGYKTEAKVVKASDYGNAQLRPRIVIVGILIGSEKTFSFPSSISLEENFQDYIEPEVDEKYHLSEEQINKMIERSCKFHGCETKDKIGFVKKLHEKARAKAEKTGGKNKSGWLCYSNWGNYVDFNIACTLTTTCANAIGIGGRVHISPDGKIWRKPTPVEMFRHQGVKNINLDGISDSQAYKMAGNGWAIGPFKVIMEEIYK